MMELVLQGDLGDRFGRNWKIAADSYGEALACIDANYPEFRKALIDLHEAGGDLSIQIGEKLVESNEELFTHLGRDTIVITPIPSGSKSGSAKAIIGTILLIAAVIMLPGAVAAAGAWSAVAAAGGGIAGGAASAAAASALLSLAGIAAMGGIGAMLLVAGLQQMWAPDPSVDQEKIYSFDGPENTVVGDTPIPILCGEMIIGGVTISSGIRGGSVPTSAGAITTYPDPPAPILPPVAGQPVVIDRGNAGGLDSSDTERRAGGGTFVMEAPN
jgi:predicted phage tail protein